jgi:hypothetical protein
VPGAGNVDVDSFCCLRGAAVPGAGNVDSFCGLRGATVPGAGNIDVDSFCGLRAAAAARLVAGFERGSMRREERKRGYLRSGGILHRAR